MMFRRSALRTVLLVLAFLPACTGITPAGVSLREETVQIPTYLIGAADPNPQFYFGGASQGAQHRIYPYPSYDNLTTEKVDKSYKMVTLENQYIRVGILPESGGKIFEGVDKTNGYNFFYRQHVIKPALISLLGAWISGGVEWDVPHHHRATSFLPVQYTTETWPDGSKTVWVGELELRDRMRWAVGLTLHPGKSYLEASFRMVNGTPLPTSMLCFSNVAVHADADYQVIFPPSTQYVTYHAKNQFTTWPVTNSRFQGLAPGVDASWWKNHINSISMFAWNYSDDFMAGYDHGKQAGTMAIADHNVVPGKKFFTWGNGPNGQSEDRQLTDGDGPYIELMVGAYSDNQPDYSVLEPYETRAWTQYWYPFRDIDGVKNANTDAAVNLTVASGRARVGFYSTSDRPAATVKLTLKDQVLLEENIAISPGKAYTKEIPLPPGADEHDLRASLSADGRELIAYSPVRLIPEPVPTPVTNAYPPPAQLKTNEELYLTGQRADQFHAPNASPEPYWQEALRRDPGDVRVNTALGVLCIRAARYAEAEKYLRTALVRDTWNYTTPKDAAPFYYLGLALKAQGKTDDAFTQFAKAAWATAWKGPAYYEMAQIASLRGDYNAALAYVNSSLENNTESTSALTLKANLCRLTGHADEAAGALAHARGIDPLNVNVMVAGDALHPANAGAATPAQKAIAAFPATGLEAASDLINAGLWRDATAMLTRACADPMTSPLADYYLGYCLQKQFELDPRSIQFKTESARFDEAAAQAPVTYAFPFQMELIPVLEAAMAAHPQDARAPYYLGNLLFDYQPERAVTLWRKSAELGADFPEVYHDLALGYTRENLAEQRDQALAWLEKGASVGGNAMIFNELDRLYEENGVDPARRLALLEAHQPVINRDDVISREINLELFAGKADAALALLKARFFHAWEGGGRFSVGDSWVNANLLHGRQQLAAKKPADALADFQAAQQVPWNLIDSAGNTAGRRAEISYCIGLAYEALGDAAKARTAWSEAAGAAATPADMPGGRGFGAGRGGRAGGAGGGQFSGRGPMGGLASGTRVNGDAAYYQGLACQKLGDAQRAGVFFQQLITAGSQAAAVNPMPGNTAIVAPATRAVIADAHYLAALGNLGLGDNAKAHQELTAALTISPDHFAAHSVLASLNAGPSDVSAMSK